MSTNKTLRIKPYFSIVAHSCDSVELRKGVWNPISFSLEDETKQGHLFKIINALNGNLDPSEISKKFNIPRTKVENVIDHLQQLGVIETSVSSAIDLYLEQFTPATNINSVQQHSQTIQFPLIFFGDNELIDNAYNLLGQNYEKISLKVIKEDHELAQLLENSSGEWLESGLEFERMVKNFESWQNHFLIFLQKNVNPQITIKLNRILYELEIPWIHAAIDGPFLFIGPTFNKNTACYECFEKRISMNVRDHVAYQKYKTALINNNVIHAKSNSLDCILKSLLISHTAMEVMNYSLTSSSFTQNKVFSIYLPTMELSFNEFLHCPNCKTCGSDHLRDSKSLYFDIHQIIDSN